jgi:hypothetical protein
MSALIPLYDELPDRVRRDLMGMIIGDELGYGIDRRTYVFAQDPTKVVKFQIEQNYFQNALEFEVWQQVKNTPYERWFAPCYGITAGGSVLLQARTGPLPKKLPELMPAFLFDFQRKNYGTYKGRIVCHDYGFPKIITSGLSKRMKKADWHD